MKKVQASKEEKIKEEQKVIDEERERLKREGR